ncbi:hypothetical protein DRN75_00960 [Nanoarchaeota archaeon]|nr:MAG: hypothetical protein DRN75_00960 [Nanoarchaeota archaeon]
MRYQIYEFYEDITDGKGACYRLRYETSWMVVALYLFMKSRKDSLATRLVFTNKEAKYHPLFKDRL